jgi:hypothetical protein
MSRADRRALVLFVAGDHALAVESLAGDEAIAWGNGLFSQNTSTLCQGCQIFIGATYQNGGKIYQMTTKCTKWQ